MRGEEFHSGDWVIYRRFKHSPSPGPRAQDVSPAPRGEEYTYFVEKFWLVDEILEDGRLRIKTRRGKEHVIAPNDPNLRHPRWWEKWLYRRRFQEVEGSLGSA